MTTDRQDALHPDLTARVVVDTTRLEWTSSPGPGVERKRLYRVGPAESGRVSSLVRYLPGARFSAHDHPEGEEILVIEGVFSDEHGDWAAGTYLMNPEGFRHAPFSEEGCLIFVRLRQAPGRDRQHVALRTAELEWASDEATGIEVRPLFEQAGLADATRLERWAAGLAPGALRRDAVTEIFVLEGGLEDEHGRYGAGTWLRLPAGAIHSPHTRTGCVLYVRSAPAELLAAPL
jgi:anti-sigma factor ChrR (cupin superfamily)